MDAGLFGHHAHHRRGDDAAGGADENHGADAQVIALDAGSAQGQGGGVDGGHEEAHAHNADEHGRLASGEEHHQEEDKKAHAVGYQDVLPGDFSHQEGAQHTSREHDHPKQAAHELADAGAQDARVLEVGHQPVDNGVLRGDIEEENGSAQPEIPVSHKALVHALDALGDVFGGQVHPQVHKQLHGAQDHDAHGHIPPAGVVIFGAGNEGNGGEHRAYGEGAVEQIVAHGGLVAGEQGHHGVAEIGIAASGNADHQAGHGKQGCAAYAEGHNGIGQAHPHGGEKHGSPAADVGGQIPGDENGGKVAPGGQAHEKARLGIADVIELPEEGHQVAHEHGRCAADAEDEQGIHHPQNALPFSG